MRTTHADGTDRGAVLVEFGLLLPVLGGLLLGVVTAGLAFFAKLEMATAAQEAARAMYLGADAGTADALAESIAVGSSASIASAEVDVASTWTCEGNTDDVVVVSMSREMTIRFLVANLDVTVPARAVIRCG